ncbi:MAG: bifunctional 3-deoxy-7-phosphoheptulonate synthase/chorismate mutase type II [Saprospiraceae bacterium]|nr:bifunctional 3-deoxy-7-phosphoheptulonate synthase/chorismate mutase type II [Saprospiraceae bacterium]
MRRFDSWGFQLDRPLVISGPCSVETEEQTMATAVGLKDYDVDILRGGIWKPRTRPNSFEGNGEKALPWLKKAGEAIGRPIAVEVATPQHVEACLKHGVDYYWIGARTSVNPFAVQEIADALKGTNVPVMVKNPINPDLKLWLGAIERIEGAGITKIAAIHRGFSHYGESVYRNQPIWQIPIDFRLERPDMPLVCDPSHIAGRRDLLFQIAQMSLDLGFDGLMIESHVNPDEAWSDAKQQVTPDRFNEMTIELRQRNRTTDDSSVKELRGALEEIDRLIIEMTSERMEVVRELGLIKKENNVAIYQPGHLAKMLERRLLKAEPSGLSKEFINNLFDAIHTESIRQQSEVFYDNPVSKSVGSKVS